MPDVWMEPCAAAESSIARGTRYAAGAALVLFASAQCAMACLLVAGTRGAPQMLYLMSACALLVAAVIALWERRRALIAVRVFAIAAAVTLLWSLTANSQPSVTTRGHVHDVTPLLAGMLLAAVLLPRLIERPASEAACNCG